MEQRKINVAFLEILMKWRVNLGCIRAILRDDDAFAAVAHASLKRLARLAVRELAEPLLVLLLDWMKTCTHHGYTHDERRITIATLERLIAHALRTISEPGELSDFRRIVAHNEVDQAWNIVGLAIRAEICSYTDDQERAALIAKYQAFGP